MTTAVHGSSRRWNPAALGRRLAPPGPSGQAVADSDLVLTATGRVEMGENTGDQVRSATLRRPGNGAPGWLHVAVIDGSPAPPSELAAAGDPYTLPLTSPRSR